MSQEESLYVPDNGKTDRDNQCRLLEPDTYKLQQIIKDTSAERRTLTSGTKIERCW